MDVDVALLESRLNYLEACLCGRSGSPLDSTNPEPIGVHISNVETRIADLAKQRESIGHFLTAYDAVGSFLESSSSLDLDPSGLDVSAQAEIVLAAEQDILTATEQIREIDSLRTFIASDTFKNIEALMRRLTPLEGRHGEHSVRLSKVQERVTALLERYNAFIMTLSELFVTYHEILCEAENKVSAAEKVAASA